MLIENNIIHWGNKVMTARSAGAGSVVAYNYATDALIQYDLNWNEVGINMSHYPGPHHVLFEGNWSQNYDSDFTFGSSIYMTVHRNHLEGKRRSFPPGVGRAARAVGLMEHSWWHSFTGNVLGYAGMDPTKWVYEDKCEGLVKNVKAACMGNKAAIWRLGYSSQQFQLGDTLTQQRVVREGNYDFLTDSVRWDSAPATLPDSLYLTAKPAFFGDLPWPWVDPLGSTKLHTLPAKRRYECLLGTPACLK